MTPTERGFHHLANLLVGLTGLVYLYMAWLLTPVDEWSVVNHPLQPDVQHLHVLVAPLLVFSTGLLWRGHALARMRQQGGPTGDSGTLLIALFVPMVLSGYALQVSEGEGARELWAWMHGLTGGLWVLAYGVHFVRRKARARLAP